jgi:hypothetical protein
MAFGDLIRQQVTLLIAPLALDDSEISGRYHCSHPACGVRSRGLPRGSKPLASEDAEGLLRTPASPSALGI